MGNHGSPYQEDTESSSSDEHHLISEAHGKIMNKAAAVLYHYPCPDGAFAALAAHLYFTFTSTPVRFFPNTVYSPLRVEDIPLNEIGPVFLFDFVGPPGFLELLSSKVESVVVLDHHKTAMERLGSGVSEHGNVMQEIDMDRSAATMSYDYFKKKLEDISICGDEKYANIAEFERCRKLFDYIEDADLWRWRLANSKAFSSGLKDLNIEFDPRLNATLFQQLLSLDPESIIKSGIASLADKQKRIDETLEESFEISLGEGAFGHCLAAYADSLIELRSELGKQLAEKSRRLKLRGIGAVVYRVPELQNNDLLKISLRSIQCEDTTRISEEYGGGGHRNASSFLLPSSRFETWKI